MGLTIEVEKSPNGVVIRVDGEVDLYSSPELRKKLLRAVPSSGGDVVVDLSGVSYIDSSGTWSRRTLRLSPK